MENTREMMRNRKINIVNMIFVKKCLTIPCGSGIVNKLSQEIASEILKNKIVFRKFKLTVDK